MRVIRDMFFSFDGIDGAGKSTQIDLFCRWLASAGHDVVRCQDPGSTPLGLAVRELVLKRDDVAVGPRAEMLLFMAARAQLVEEVIRPALAAGKTVVSDRYLLANVVYQGHGGGLDVEALWQIGHVATGGLTPDLTFVLDLSVDVARARLGADLDRLERRSYEYHERLRQGFLTEAARQRQRIAVVDASQPIEAIAEQIRTASAAALRR